LNQVFLSFVLDMAMIPITVWEIYIIINLIKSAIRLKRKKYQACPLGEKIAQLILYPIVSAAVTYFLMKQSWAMLSAVESDLLSATELVSFMPAWFMDFLSWFTGAMPWLSIVSTIQTFLFAAALCTARLLLAVKENKGYVSANYNKDSIVSPLN